VYLLTSRLGGRRAGLLAAVATASFPMYALVARQAMTDMAFVGPMTLALALGALALEEGPDEAALPRRGRGRLSWPHHPLFYAGLILWLLVTVPQLLVDSIDLRVRLPWQGRMVTLYGIAAMWPYWVGVVLVPGLVARSRRRAPLYLFIAAVLCGLAVLGKGIAGLALPVIIFAVHVLVSGRWRRLTERDLALALPVALLAVAVVAIPWHHAMYVRHGQAWLSELFGDNHWRRLMIGRHGDRGTFEYFVRELGYGVWPLVALVPAALAGGIWGAPLDPGRRLLLRFGAIWFVTAYALVSLSMTKFHHYILPALPGMGILIGLLLDQMLELRRARAVALVALIGLPLLALVTWDLVATRDAAERFLWLFSYDYVHNPAGRPVAGCARLPARAARAGGRLRPGRRRAGLAPHPPCGRGRNLRGGAGLEHVPHQPLHAPGGTVLVAEAGGGPLLPRPTRAGRTPDRLLPVLAGRDLLHG
jgi:4-amino-4-deoxy-L-arabinose transferase-like glycosyltransferase